MVPQVNVNMRSERHEPIFDEENCISTDTHRKVNKVTREEREPQTFTLAMNRCNSESIP